ncbi:hypothetical protein JDV02_006524 [Purpureocillium takamizusanense]|uniref:Methyltransferase domain-containing protein n=1 Tax=Purpureocillium takamizusanense TaxID=2060973 RepID=A0A9Q8VCU5_9HYPO|nr:uncharacterized protein JDV02_006524 [Purpureocillium takamizusanense]UNI20436.1 hypothetical protein JDV02_006524 [Purpureocillium takamizusanense]
MPADFGNQSYWRERFTHETQFEWLLPSADFMAMLQPHLDRLDPSSARILHLGSGTSDLATHLRGRGFLDVLNVDYEPLAAERGRDLERRAFGDVRMRYAVADATQLGSGSDGVDPRARFDLVVDKSTVDAVSCAGGEALARMARGVRQRLADGAAWISLSYSSRRFDDVEHLPFDVEVIARVPTPKLSPADPDVYHCCYLMTPK